MSVELSEEVQQFIAEQRNGVIATFGKNGAAQLTVVTHGLYRGAPAFTSAGNLVKVRNLTRDPRCSYIVVSPNGRSYITLEGHADLYAPGVTDPEVAAYPRSGTSTAPRPARNTPTGTITTAPWSSSSAGASWWSRSGSTTTWADIRREAAMPFAQIRDIRMYYERRGSGPRLLYISGTGGDLRAGRVFEGPLAEGFDLLAYDQRGLGQTDKPDVPYTMADYAEDAAALLDHVGWDRGAGHRSLLRRAWSPRSLRPATRSASSASSSPARRAAARAGVPTPCTSSKASLLRRR